LYVFVSRPNGELQFLSVGPEPAIIRTIGEDLALFGIVIVPEISPVAVFNIVSDSQEIESFLDCANNPVDKRFRTIISDKHFRE
jgi:hypothetical protein